MFRNSLDVGAKLNFEAADGVGNHAAEDLLPLRVEVRTIRFGAAAILNRRHRGGPAR